MDKSLQTRLIGAILLVAVGVIVIPALLDGSGYKSRTSRSVSMPPEPEFPPLSETSLKAVEPVHKKQTPPKPAPAPVTKKTSKPPVQMEVKEPAKAFALQVSTVTVKKNAYELRDKLRKAGYTAYVESSSKGGKTSYRVRIGPELDIARMEALKKKVKKEQGLDGFIVNHP